MGGDKKLNYQENDRINILLLAANPIETKILKLDEELYQIESEILSAKYRDRFNLEPKFAVRVTDLTRHFMRHKPEIVHFSGHGSDTNSLIFLDDNRDPFYIPPAGLAKLFGVLKPKVKCVVMNACWTDVQGKAIAKHVDNVIGMSREFEDESAITFAKGFYRGLLDGQTIAKAFEFGKVQMGLMGSSGQDVPQFYSKDEDSKNYKFVE